MPTVSVVIPTYNSAATLAETLESVREQTLRDFEVIIIDDGSRDDTIRVATTFSGSLDLRILSQANAGPSAARNTGVRAARASYCAFIDSDDLMIPQRLEEQVAAFDADPRLGLVHTDLMTFDDTGIIHRTRRAFSDPCGGWILDRLLIDNFITTSTVLASRERLLEAGLFNERRRISEDFELWLRMGERWPIGYVDKPLVKYRRRPGSLSDDKLVTGLAALDVIEQFWQTHAEYARQHRSLRRRSLAGHLSVAGSAALARGKPRDAFGFMLRSLRYDAVNPASWRELAKVVLTPLRQRGFTRAARGTDI